MSTLAGTTVLLGRQYRLLGRQPVWIAIMLVQPVVWLVLYSQLFRSLPGLGLQTTSYVEFLTPGVAIMSAFSHGSWEGAQTMRELEQGVFARFLTTPMDAAALVLARVCQAALTGLLQAGAILLLSLPLGARIHGGAAGWAAILLAAALVAASFAGIADTIALLVRREETVIALAQFAVLPLTFLSATLISEQLMPHWMRVLASVNPVNWAVTAARAATLPDTDWSTVAAQLGLLAVCAGATLGAALLALGHYRRSL
jgi:ABC-2 type transport system permease protein